MSTKGFETETQEKIMNNMWPDCKRRKLVSLEKWTQEDGE